VVRPAGDFGYIVSTSGVFVAHAETDGPLSDGFRAVEAGAECSSVSAREDAGLRLSTSRPASPPRVRVSLSSGGPSAPEHCVPGGRGILISACWWQTPVTRSAAQRGTSYGTPTGRASRFSSR
jgi:hypothetical protein